MPHIDLVQGDITSVDVDAIVNATNRTLTGGGRVNAAIHAAAGPMLLGACSRLDACHAGEACLTGGYDLPARYVIHTVGPMYVDGSSGESDLLACCHQSCLEIASGYELRTVAFPAIGCGAAGYPATAAAEVAINAISTFMDGDSTLKRVMIICRGEDLLHAYQRALAGWREAA